MMFFRKICEILDVKASRRNFDVFCFLGIHVILKKYIDYGMNDYMWSIDYYYFIIITDVQIRRYLCLSLNRSSYNNVIVGTVLLPKSYLVTF